MKYFKIKIPELPAKSFTGIASETNLNENSYIQFEEVLLSAEQLSKQKQFLY